MYKITEEQRKALLQYLVNRPFGEVTQLVSMLASLKIEKEKEDESKKDLS
jgi:DNA-binding PadR family transcriptional regulator|tara:strand:- start:908 stop:1057 length:150 start_codon:yes stop_codon:yes gene_type:complete